jgi:hypothetical protein
VTAVEKWLMSSGTAFAAAGSTSAAASRASKNLRERVPDLIAGSIGI